MIRPKPNCMKVVQAAWPLFLVCAVSLVQTAEAQRRCIEVSPGKFESLNGGRCVNTIQTAVPFLTISPDARSAALGDAGVALSPTAASSYWNGSALAFSQERFEIQATFTPWLQALKLDDVYLANLSAYGKISDSETLYGDLRYFSLGSIEFTDVNGQAIATGKPYEMAFSFGYARKLSEKISANLTGRFILSALASGLIVPDTGAEIGNGLAGAADLGFSYVDDVAIGANGSILRIGASIRNIGSKITYTRADDRDYLPTNLALGTSLETFFDDYNSLTFTVDFNKLLVPSPPLDSVMVDVDPSNGRSDHLDKSPIEGIFSSFSDAPGGFNEELQEINVSLGAEYWYANQFAARVGYFHESAIKGARQYLTLGIGIKYNVLGLDFSYLVPTSSTRNPLDNTLRFGLNYAFAPSTPEGVPN